MVHLLDITQAHNPFQVLTLIVAPAILTNSSSVLSLSTSNRFARNVDRSRALYDKLKRPETLMPTEQQLYEKQLLILGQRAQILVKALTFFYFSVGAFAATALTSIMGAASDYLQVILVSKIATGFALMCGIGGVFGLVSGTGLLVRETWLAMSFLKTETCLTDRLIAHEPL